MVLLDCITDHLFIFILEIQIMTGLFMGFIIAIATRTGNNNQELINNNSWLAIYNEWKGCWTVGLILAHRHYPLGAVIAQLQTGDKFNYNGCLYRVESKQIVKNESTKYNTLLSDWLRLQTCERENWKTLFIKAKNQKKRLIKTDKKV